MLRVEMLGSVRPRALLRGDAARPWATRRSCPSRKPDVKVRTLVRRPAARACDATMVDESTPPLRKAPNGTSLTRRWRTGIVDQRPQLFGGTRSATQRSACRGTSPPGSL
jgi:hypothetical protein